MNPFKFLFILLLVIYGGQAVSQESFFPEAYKVFKYNEGDILAFQDKDGWSITKIIKITKVSLKAGETISIQNKVFTAPIDDYLLIIGTSFSKPYKTLDELKLAVKNNKWEVQIGHVPRRTPGIGDGSIFIGNQPVSKEELSGYFQWKSAFDKGEAGVF